MKYLIKNLKSYFCTLFVTRICSAIVGCKKTLQMLTWEQFLEEDRRFCYSLLWNLVVFKEVQFIAFMAPLPSGNLSKNICFTVSCTRCSMESKCLYSLQNTLLFKVCYIVLSSLQYLEAAIWIMTGLNSSALHFLPGINLNANFTEILHFS